MWFTNWGDDLVAYSGKYFVFNLLKPRAWYRHLEVQVPECRNWHRLLVFLPVGGFAVTGWLCWGRRPA